MGYVTTLSPAQKESRTKKLFYEHGISIFPPRLYTVFVDNLGGRLQAQFAA